MPWGDSVLDFFWRVARRHASTLWLWDFAHRHGVSRIAIRNLIRFVKDFELSGHRIAYALYFNSSLIALFSIYTIYWSSWGYKDPQRLLFIVSILQCILSFITLITLLTTILLRRSRVRRNPFHLHRALYITHNVLITFWIIATTSTLVAILERQLPSSSSSHPSPPLPRLSLLTYRIMPTFNPVLLTLLLCVSSYLLHKLWRADEERLRLFAMDWLAHRHGITLRRVREECRRLGIATAHPYVMECDLVDALLEELEEVAGREGERGGERGSGSGSGSGSRTMRARRSGGGGERRLQARSTTANREARARERREWYHPPTHPPYHPPTYPPYHPPSPSPNLHTRSTSQTTSAPSQPSPTPTPTTHLTPSPYPSGSVDIADADAADRDAVAVATEREMQRAMAVAAGMWVV